MSDWATHAQATLTARGHRSGGARAAVVDLLAGQHCCLSAQEIHERLRERDSAVGLASVYRALDLLTSLHLLHRIDRDGVAQYEPAHPGGEHHHHAICDACGKVEPFEDDSLENRLHAVLRRLGYAGHGHDVVLRGTCRACR